MANEKTILLNVGSNWDPELLEGIRQFKMRSWHTYDGIKLFSLYGSIPDNPWGTARPSNRLRKSSLDSFSNMCDLAHDMDIKVNYTLNASCFGSLSIFKPGPDHQYAMDYLKAIDEIVDMYTVAHPLMLDLLCKFSSKPIEISVIMNMRTMGQMRWAKTRWPNVNKVCIALDRNRDIGWLSAAAACSPKIPEIELLANEFCSIGGHPCQGLLRTSCYQCHSHNVGNAADGYPMNICTASRWEEPSSWLKAKFILPQWMRKYRDKTGVRNFKITGRTHPTEYILKMADAYMRQQYDENILGLWAQLETIWKGFKVQDDMADSVNIPASLVDYHAFIDHWFGDMRLKCSDMFCGVKCKYCDGVYKDITDQLKARKDGMKDREAENARRNEGS